MQEIEALKELEASLQAQYDRLEAALKCFAEKSEKDEAEAECIRKAMLTTEDAKIADEMQTKAAQYEAEGAHISEALIAMKDVQTGIGVKIGFIRGVVGAVLAVLGYPNGFGNHWYGNTGDREAKRPEEPTQEGASCESTDAAQEG